MNATITTYIPLTKEQLKSMLENLEAGGTAQIRLEMSGEVEQR